MAFDSCAWRAVCVHVVRVVDGRVDLDELVGACVLVVIHLLDIELVVVRVVVVVVVLVIVVLGHIRGAAAAACWSMLGDRVAHVVFAVNATHFDIGVGRGRFDLCVADNAKAKVDKCKSINYVFIRSHPIIIKDLTYEHTCRLCLVVCIVLMLVPLMVEGMLIAVAVVVVGQVALAERAALDEHELALGRLIVENVRASGAIVVLVVVGSIPCGGGRVGRFRRRMIACHSRRRLRASASSRSPQSNELASRRRRRRRRRGRGRGGRRRRCGRGRGSDDQLTAQSLDLSALVAIALLVGGQLLAVLSARVVQLAYVGAQRVQFALVGSLHVAQSLGGAALGVGESRSQRVQLHNTGSRVYCRWRWRRR